MKRISYNSPVVLTFAIAALGALGLNMLTGGRANAMFFSVYPSRLTDPLTYVRLFGHVLGHADLSHYINNMVLMLVVGPPLEEKYGSKPLLWAIAVTAAVSGIIHCVISPSTALLGASGIVFMMIMMSSLSGMEQGTVPLTLILVGMIYIGGEVLRGLTTRDAVSQLTHVVGGICGTVLGLRLGRGRE